MGRDRGTRPCSAKDTPAPSRPQARRVAGCSGGGGVWPEFDTQLRATRLPASGAGPRPRRALGSQWSLPGGHQGAPLRMGTAVSLCTCWPPPPQPSVPLRVGPGGPLCPQPCALDSVPSIAPAPVRCSASEPHQPGLLSPLPASVRRQCSAGQARSWGVTATPGRRQGAPAGPARPPMNSRVPPLALTRVQGRPAPHLAGGL